MGRVVEHPGLYDSLGSLIPGRLIEIAAVDTYVYDHGIGPTLIFLHGYGDTADGWRRVIPSLPEYRVIAIDVPPFGRSEDPNRLRPTPDLVEFYREFFPQLFERFEIPKATLIGHSLGATIALESALERPELVERLVVIAPAGLDTGAPLWWRLVAAIGTPGGSLLRSSNPLARRVMRTTVRGFIDRLVVHNPRALQGELDYLADLYSSGHELDKILRAGHALIGSYSGDLAERAGALGCPTLAIWGRQDALVPVAHAEILAQSSPQVHTEILESCGHYPQIELPDQFNFILHQFLSSNPISKPDSATIAHSKDARKPISY